MTSGHDAYRTVSAHTADPITLTVMLYEGSLKAIRKARLYGQQGDRDRFLNEAGRAYLIIGELLATLDQEQGGPLAGQMAAVYEYCMRSIVQATTGDPSGLDEAEKHMARLGGAWRQAADAVRAEFPAAVA